MTIQIEGEFSASRQSESLTGASISDLEFGRLFTRAQEFVDQILASADEQAERVVAEAMLEASKIETEAKRRAQKLMDEAESSGPSARVIRDLQQSIDSLIQDNRALISDLTILRSALGIERDGYSHTSTRPPADPYGRR